MERQSICKVKKPFRDKAFTLMELLVVISIIALLLAVLMPSLASARRQARLLTCTANSKQIASMIMIYQVDNEGAVPIMFNIWAGNVGKGKNTHLSLALKNYIPKRGSWPYNYAELGGGGWIIQYYKKYLPEFFVCPFVRSGKVSQDPWGGYSQVALSGSGGRYTFNTRQVEGYMESYWTWIWRRERGRIMMNNHPFGPPAGVLKYGELNWYEPYPLDFTKLRPAKWSAQHAKAVKCSNMGDVTVAYCGIGEALDWDAGNRPIILNYKSHPRGRQGGTVAIFGDGHVDWVPGTQIGEL